MNSLEVYFFLTSPSNCFPAQWLMTEESVVFKCQGGILCRTLVIEVELSMMHGLCKIQQCWDTHSGERGNILHGNLYARCKA